MKAKYIATKNGKPTLVCGGLKARALQALGLDLEGLLSKSLSRIPRVDYVESKVYDDFKVESWVLFKDHNLLLEGEINPDTLEVIYGKDLRVTWRDGLYSVTTIVTELLKTLEARMAVHLATELIKKHGLRASVLEDTFSPILVYQGKVLELIKEDKSISEKEIQEFLS
jgi:hypothetical protein